MKPTLINLSFLLLFFTHSFAQNIQVSSVNGTNHLAIIIANIFGIQCEGVSNVTLIGQNQQVGRFMGGDILGLKSGLILSTGAVSSSIINQPSSQFISTDFFNSGDNDIELHGLPIGASEPSHDAVSISFQFNPLFSDTIQFKYIFASEEYPEYANSQFSDRFLYLVSENGGPFTNIALVPGTGIPVEINNVNASVNSYFYINNQTSINAPFFFADGYTKPFYARFYAQVGSTYQIKIVIADVSDGIYDSTILLEEEHETYSEISGSLSINQFPAEGTIDIFNYLADTVLALPFKSIPVQMGNYAADSLPSGLYHIRFTPNSILFPNVAPLYYTNGDNWTNASAIGLPCFENTLDLTADSLDVLNGTGTIFGNIIIDTSFQKTSTEPFSKALIKLFNDQNKLVAFTYSDQQGNYSFHFIPVGMYYIKIDAPYIPQVDINTLEIHENETISNVDFEVLLSGIHASTDIKISFSDNNSDLVLYPNPASDKITVINKTGNDLPFELFSVSGAFLMNGVIDYGYSKINTTSLENGIYFLRIDRSVLRKIVIDK